jgi:hypothetical protein
VAIWKNESDKGPFYSAQPFRTYKDAQDKYHDVHSFSGADILKAQRLLGQAYDRIADLRAADVRTET